MKLFVGAAQQLCFVVQAWEHSKKENGAGAGEHGGPARASGGKETR